MISDRTIEFLLSSAKLVGATLSGAFGILGLLTEYRDQETKKITVWGKVALVGILASTGVAISAEALGIWKENRSAEQSAEKTNALLTEISRTLSPISDMTVSFSFTLPLDRKEFAKYSSRLSAGMKAIAARPRFGLDGSVLLNDSGTPELVSVSCDSKLFPSQKEDIPYHVIREAMLQMDLYRKPIPVTQYLAHFKNGFQEYGRMLPDLRVVIPMPNLAGCGKKRKYCNEAARNASHCA
jgi:hypothetical protein